MDTAAKIVVFRPGALGDLILAAPVLDALIEAHRAMERHLSLHVFASMPHGSALNAGKARWGELAVHDFGSRECAALFGRGQEVSGNLREVLRDADPAIAFLKDDDPVFREQLAACGARRAIVHPSLPPGATHASEHLWRALASLGLPIPERPPTPAPESPVLRVRGRDLRLGMARMSALFPAGPGGLLALHPGSGGKAKWAPPRIFAALAKEAPTVSGLTPFFIRGPADADAMDRVLALLPAADRPPVLDTPPLRELAGILSSCDAYVGNDSGVSHLAAALGVPTLALFGPTDPEVWGPRGLAVRVLRYRIGERGQWLAPEDVTRPRRTAGFAAEGTLGELADILHAIPEAEEA